MPTDTVAKERHRLLPSFLTSLKSTDRDKNVKIQLSVLNIIWLNKLSCYLFLKLLLTFLTVIFVNEVKQENSK